MTRLRRHGLAAPAMTYRLPVARGHFHRHEGVVPAQAAGQLPWRRRRRAMPADLLTAAAASCRVQYPGTRPAVGHQCLPGSGFLMDSAVTVHDGTAFVFASQNPTGTKATDRAAFRQFLAGIRLKR